MLGFYYRAINVRKQFQYEAVWKSTLAPVFPAGLAAAPTDSARPAGGVIVTKDNQTARQAGLQAGDIIVGLEGWRVANLQQYRAVNAFFEPEQTQMKLTVWRGHLFPVTVVAPDRFIGIEFRSYPIEGWSEK